MQKHTVVQWSGVAIGVFGLFNIPGYYYVNDFGRTMSEAAFGLICILAGCIITFVGVRMGDGK